MSVLLAGILSSTQELSLFSKEVQQAPIFKNSLDFTDIAVKSFVSLILVVLLIFIVYFLLSRHRTLLQKSENFIILDFMVLEPKKTLYLMDICGRIIIVAVTDQNINLLTEITDKQKCDSLRLGLNRQSEKSFSNLFSSKLGNREKNIENLKRKLEKLSKEK